MRRIKKLPKKHTSQGGKGRETFPGAIGRNHACAPGAAESQDVSGLTDDGSVSSATALASVLRGPLRVIINEGDVFSVDDPTTWLRKLFCVMYCFLQTLSTATAEVL
jgi:hypothetical protein